MREILEDLKRLLEGVPEETTERFTRRLVEARRIFMYGVGRSGLMARSFGMRLVHLGREATVVGDTTPPAIQAGDLLVVCSRTGVSPILHHAVHLARKEGAGVAVVIGLEGAPLGQDADVVVRLPIDGARGESRQPMGSLFEQGLLLYLDSVVLKLMAALHRTSEDMERVHSNLP